MQHRRFSRGAIKRKNRPHGTGQARSGQVLTAVRVVRLLLMRPVAVRKSPPISRRQVGGFCGTMLQTRLPGRAMCARNVTAHMPHEAAAA